MSFGKRVNPNFKSVEKKPKSTAHRQDPKHLEFVRSLPCTVCRDDPPNDPHHLFCTGDRGMGRREADWNTISICRRCHDAMHLSSKTELDWLGSRGVIFVALLADRLWKNSGDYELGLAILDLHRR